MVVALEDVIGQKDSLLIARHRAGDPKAFEKLYDTHYAMLLRFVRRRVRQHEAVEDIAQEAFVRAFAAMDGLREASRFYPWLTVIARRLIIDHYRFHGRLTVVEDLDAGQTDGPEVDLLERQEHADLAAALQRVRGRHREVLHLRETEELSYQQIARRLDVPATTVPSLLHRARLALRREFLALTEQERTGVFLPVFFLITDAARRVRDRVLHVAAYLPDPQALTGSFAAVAVGVGALFSAPVFADAQLHQESAPLGSEAVSHPGVRGDEDRVEARAVDVGQPSQVDASVPAIAPYQPKVSLGQDSAEKGRRDDRHMPQYIEEAGIAVGADPEELHRDVASSLAGDYGWIER